ncbi:hypothetical protein D3C81_2332700 [compost metagenome]
MKLCSSPGSSVMLSACDPIGDQPLATELVGSPATTACGLSRPLYIPTKASRSVSKPAISLFTE